MATAGVQGVGISRSGELPLAVAHRGESIAERENALAAFLAAVDCGADMVELDCQVTSDGRTIVLHHETLQRLWGRPDPVASTPWDEVAALGDGAMRVPLLAEVLSAIAMPLMVDVGSPEVLAATHAEVRAADALQRCVFVGDLAALRLLRHLDRRARIGLTWIDRALPDERLLAELSPELFNPSSKLVNAALVATFHRRGLGVSTWTVDHPQEMQRLIGLGVDMIVTNRVADLVEQLEGHRRR